MQEKYFAIYSKTAFWMLYLCSAIWKNRCRGGKNMPTIHFRLLQGLQKRHRDSVQTFAGIAKTRQKSGHKNAGVAKTPPRFGSDFCRDCKNAPGFRAECCRVCNEANQIQG